MCYRLTNLSELLWASYAGSAGLIELDDIGELGRDDDVQASFALVVPALYLPNLPDGDGILEISGVPVEDHAHALGRLLYSLDDPGLTDAVVAEVSREMRAVEQAGRGDLTGRAAQAVVIDRLDICPTQVATADSLLYHDPLGSLGLLTSIDPAAACVAAAHWLAAAAGIVGEVTGVATARLFDHIEPAVVSVPALVAHAVLVEGLAPHTVVQQLLRQAIAAKQGRIPDLAGLLDDVAAARRQAKQAPKGKREELLASLLPRRTTPLDPTRPTRDLLEHLLDGIRGCLVVLANHVDRAPPGRETGHDSRGTDATGAVANRARHPDPVLERFVRSTRETATAQRGRLLR